MKTYGCTLNKSDGACIEKAIVDGGHELSGEEAADVIVINSCAVKRATQQKILAKLRELRGRRVLVTGCFAQALPEVLRKKFPEFSILGTFSQARVLEAVESVFEGKHFDFVGKGNSFSSIGLVDGVVARIKISEGCLGKCSFCITKLARGKLKSVPVKEIIRSVECAVLNGAKEIQLCSQDTGCYGFDLGTDLASLVERICEIKGRFLVRLGMMNPENARKILPMLLSVLRNSKVYKFVHIPVQSGSDSVLRGMNRSYSANDFVFLVNELRKAFPEITVATDVIVGFPTEKDEDFFLTARLLKEVKPDIVNVSRFSPMPKTPAFKLSFLKEEVVNGRSKALSFLCSQISLENNQELVGKEFEVLVTEKKKNGWLARTSSYKPVVVEKKGIELGDFTRVFIESAGVSHLKAV